MVVVRSATVTLPDGRLERQRKVTVADGVITVMDRRTGRTIWQATITQGSPAGRRWSVLTDAGTIQVRSGCGCGGNR